MKEGDGKTPQEQFTIETIPRKDDDWIQYFFVSQASKKVLQCTPNYACVTDNTNRLEWEAMRISTIRD